MPLVEVRGDSCQATPSSTSRPFALGIDAGPHARTARCQASTGHSWRLILRLRHVTKSSYVFHFALVQAWASVSFFFVPSIPPCQP